MSQWKHLYHCHSSESFLNLPRFLLFRFSQSQSHAGCFSKHSRAITVLHSQDLPHGGRCARSLALDLLGIFLYFPIILLKWEPDTVSLCLLDNGSQLKTEEPKGKYIYKFKPFWLFVPTGTRCQESKHLHLAFRNVRLNYFTTLGRHDSLEEAIYLQVN